MKIEYIIIQAGGKGTRLKELTRNKPKGIVPVNNIPIIFNWFNRYPDRKFIIIGDYKHKILEEYLEAFCKVRYITVKTENKGTCAGIKEALSCIPDNEPFVLAWSDLILGNDVDIDVQDKDNYLGLSRDFECRWSFENGEFLEKPSKERGVAGFFIFKSKDYLDGVPESGEFVRWLQKGINIFQEFSLGNTREVGTLAAIDEVSKKSKHYRTRAFNTIEDQGDRLVKIPLDDQGRKLASLEIAWYREANKYEFRQIPEIFSFNPLTMEKINGINIYRAKLTRQQKEKVIDNLVDSLNRLHNMHKAPCDVFSIMEAYYHKTINRIEKVRDLIPFADQQEININGKNCRNPFFYKDEFREKVKKMLCNCKEFVFIHGDCTFSNTMVDKDLNVTFLDPRGYFGSTVLYGDPYYDWAKLYYSIYGDYDQFNNHNFSLEIGNDCVVLEISSNGWEDVAEYFLNSIPEVNKDKIMFLHAIIWISLTTYAWEDFDSICGAFYKGAFLMNEFLR